MPTLTAAQVAGVASNPPTGSTTAQWVAKARQESGFRTDVEDFLSSGHWGLWQISEDHWDKPWNDNVGSKANFVNMLKGANFNWRQAQFLYSEARENGGTGWEPWNASGGAPRPSAADNAAAGTPDTSVGAGGGDAGDLGEAISGLGPLNPLDDVYQAVKAGVQTLIDAAKWLGDPGNWVRVLQVGGGIALALVAVTIVLKPAIT